MAWDHKYRPLERGEIVKPGDEIQDDDGVWRKPTFTGCPAPDPNYTSHRQYRRIKT